MTKIMVILATYNGERFLEQQINSILVQENVEVEIIVSDDQSTDKTLNVLEKFAHENMCVFQNNPGTGSAANNFLKRIGKLDFEQSFDFVAFADQDDIWLPEKMKAAVDLLKNTESDLYCSNLTKWDTSDNSYSLLKKDFSQKKYDFLFEGGSAGCTYVFTKHFAQKLQEFLINLDSSDWKGFSHDWLVYFFARSRNYKVVIDSNSYIHYRLHDENVHGHLNKLSLATIKEKSKQVLDGYYQNHALNFIKYLATDSPEFKVYKMFLGNYIQRNTLIWKYNTELMRDRKKFLIFAILNLLKFR